MVMSAKALRREHDAGAVDQKRGKPNKFWTNLREAIDGRQVTMNDFSFRELMEEFVPSGRELVSSYNPRHGGVGLLEAAPVTTGSFANISGQLVISEVLDAYNSPGLIGDQLVTVVPTNFDGEKIPGIGRIGDQAESVMEGQPYPRAGFSEEWVETPPTIKRGMIIDVTKETIFFDRTGLVTQRAREIGEMIAINREKRILDVVFGITTSYRRNGAAAEATYSDTGSFGDNIAGSNTLIDWTDIENALLLFDALSDPSTGEPIVVVPDTIVVPTALSMTARRILNTTEINFGATASATATTMAMSSNPLKGMALNPISSPYVKLRTSSASTWFIGQFKKAFRYMENWPITTVQAPANNEAEFNRDIVLSFKSSERGAAAVKDPRYVVKCT